jgi:murein DD-endopeptidase MepM/ murein hydrolase activator NlpD
LSLKQNKEVLEVKKTAKETEKKTLTGLKDQLAGQKQVTEEIKKEKNQLLTVTQNKESNYQKMLADSLQRKKAVEAEMADVEQQIKIAIDPSSLPKVGSGVLLWPLTKVIITQYFGNTSFASTHTILYGGKGHNGIDLGIPIGTTVMSAAEGRVIGTGDTDKTCPRASYGKWVLIEHPNGLSTLYGHLSVIRVEEGQTVYANQPIGFSGNTGYSTGPHLHFTVYASQGVKVSSLQSKACGGVYRIPVASYNSYLNPLAYLPAK